MALGSSFSSLVITTKWEAVAVLRPEPEAVTYSMLHTGAANQITSRGRSCLRLSPQVTSRDKGSGRALVCAGPTEPEGPPACLQKVSL